MADAIALLFLLDQPVDLDVEPKHGGGGCAVVSILRCRHELLLESGERIVAIVNEVWPAPEVESPLFDARGTVWTQKIPRLRSRS
jgi:hypothetical protein